MNSASEAEASDAELVAVDRKNASVADGDHSSDVDYTPSSPENANVADESPSDSSSEDSSDDIEDALEGAQGGGSDSEGEGAAEKILETLQQQQTQRAAHDC